MRIGHVDVTKDLQGNPQVVGFQLQNNEAVQVIIVGRNMVPSCTMLPQNLKDAQHRNAIQNLAMQVYAGLSNKPELIKYAVLALPPTNGVSAYKLLKLTRAEMVCLMMADDLYQIKKGLNDTDVSFVYSILNGEGWKGYSNFSDAEITLMFQEREDEGHFDHPVKLETYGYLQEFRKIFGLKETEC